MTNKIYHHDYLSDLCVSVSKPEYLLRPRVPLSIRPAELLVKNLLNRFRVCGRNHNQNRWPNEVERVHTVEVERVHTVDQQLKGYTWVANFWAPEFRGEGGNLHYSTRHAKGSSSIFNFSCKSFVNAMLRSCCAYVAQMLPLATKKTIAHSAIVKCYLFICSLYYGGALC